MDVEVGLIALTAFLSVGALTFVIGQYVRSAEQFRRRLPVAAGTGDGDARSESAFGALVAQHFDEQRYGIDGALKRRLKLQLLRAGFFSPLAIRYYVFARLCAVVVPPSILFIAVKAFAPEHSPVIDTVMASIAAGVGILGPDAYLSRRQGALVREHRLIFPDLLDLLTVCVTAGLSLEAAFERIRDHLATRSVALAKNIELLGAELRAGRSTVEALGSLADRLSLDEASSFVAMLRQSVELGGDVASSLRVFSETMRAKRILLAEKKANELPVKIVLPMALGIFPVILMIILLPVVMSLAKVMH
jgi:tight adherence protein C